METVDIDHEAIKDAMVASMLEFDGDVSAIPEFEVNTKAAVDLQRMLSAKHAGAGKFKKPIIIADSLKELTMENFETKKEDMLFAKTVSSVLKEIQIDTPNTLDELARILLSSKIVISQRYYGSLFSTMCKIPTLSLSKDPKMSALCKEFSLFPCTDLSVFNTPKDLLMKTESARAHFSSQKEEIARLVEEKSKLCKKSLAKLFINI